MRGDGRIFFRGRKHWIAYYAPAPDGRSVEQREPRATLKPRPASCFDVAFGRWAPTNSRCSPSSDRNKNASGSTKYSTIYWPSTGWAEETHTARAGCRRSPILSASETISGICGPWRSPNGVWKISFPCSRAGTTLTLRSTVQPTAEPGVRHRGVRYPVQGAPSAQNSSA